MLNDTVVRIFKSCEGYIEVITMKEVYKEKKLPSKRYMFLRFSINEDITEVPQLTEEELKEILSIGDLR